MANQQRVKLDRLFHALGDPTRGAVALSRIGGGLGAVRERLVAPAKTM